MPTTSRWLVRAALLHLVLGAAAGGTLLLASHGWVAAPGAILSRTLHIHLVSLGFFTQFALGVALWIFPRAQTADPPSGTSDRAVTAAAGWDAGVSSEWLAGVLLNAGVLLVALSPALRFGERLGWACEVLGVGILAARILPRVRKAGKLQ